MQTLTKLADLVDMARSEDGIMKGITKEILENNDFKVSLSQVEARLREGSASKEAFEHIESRMEKEFCSKREADLIK